MSDLREFDGDLVEALGPDFEVGMPVSCDKCLAGCWGFDQFRPDEPAGARRAAPAQGRLTRYPRVGADISRAVASAGAPSAAKAVTRETLPWFALAV